MAALYPRKMSAVQIICFDQRSKGKLLLMDRMGGGKSLTMMITTVIINKITTLFNPLLTLTAD